MGTEREVRDKELAKIALITILALARLSDWEMKPIDLRLTTICRWMTALMGTAGLTPKKLGWVVRTLLHLRTARTTNRGSKARGYEVLWSEKVIRANREMWGVKDAEVGAMMRGMRET